MHYTLSGIGKKSYNNRKAKPFMWLYSRFFMQSGGFLYITKTKAITFHLWTTMKLMSTLTMISKEEWKEKSDEVKAKVEWINY